MNHRPSLSLFCVALFGFVQSSLFGGDDDYTRQSLVHISSLDVVIEGLPSGASRIGLTKEVIQTDVELKLRLAGIHVGSQALQYLYVNTNVSNDASAASFIIELRQPATLVRDPKITALGATTWSLSGLITNPTGDGIRSIIKDQIDHFLNAWLAVNPKK
jgi:hypothetical protein